MIKILLRYLEVSVVRRDSWMDIVSMFEKDKVCCINSRDCIEICTDKYRTSIKLADFGLRQPKSSLITDKENALKAFRKFRHRLSYNSKNIKRVKR